jgi:hypothetical protein
MSSSGQCANHCPSKSVLDESSGTLQCIQKLAVTFACARIHFVFAFTKLQRISYHLFHHRACRVLVKLKFRSISANGTYFTEKYKVRKCNVGHKLNGSNSSKQGLPKQLTRIDQQIEYQNRKTRHHPKNI